MARVLTPLKDAIEQQLKDNQLALGIKTIARDITPDALADGGDEQDLVKAFPAVIIVYQGSTGQRLGRDLQRDPVLGLVVCMRSVAKAHAAEPVTDDLLDDLVTLLEGKVLAPTVQRAGLEFLSDVLIYRSKVLTIQQILFKTNVIQQVN